MSYNPYPLNNTVNTAFGLDIVTKKSPIHETGNSNTGKYYSPVTTAQRLALNPTNGLTVYDITVGALYTGNGTAWVL